MQKYLKYFLLKIIKIVGINLNCSGTDILVYFIFEITNGRIC